MIISMHLRSLGDRLRSNGLRRAGAAALLVLVGAAGCSSSSTGKPQVGQISFTDAAGVAQATPPTALTVNNGTYLEVALNNDPQLLGANWSITCGSQLPPGSPLPPGYTVDPSCGTLSTYHTLGGPVPSFASSAAQYITFYTAPAAPVNGGTVTIYASASSDPSRFTSVTLTINGLPIAVGFSPAPPTTVSLGSATPIKATLSGDYTAAGATWSVTCGSATCGSFSSTQTTSGVATVYTAPTTVPTGGTVTIKATSVADSTKSVSQTITISPITVVVSPTTLNVSTASTGTLNATIANDSASAGVDWTVTCTNTITPGVCGSVSPTHTASGAATTYTAPNFATIGAPSTVIIKATSTTDKVTSAISTVTTVKALFVGGTVNSNSMPVSGANVALYAAASNGFVPVEPATAITGDDGSFTIPVSYTCPSPSAQMYLVSTGGNAGAGINPNLVLLSALGTCSSVEGSSAVVNEATTVAGAYALSAFATDAAHIGSAATSPTALASAFSSASDLVDTTTGDVRHVTSSNGVVPRSKLDTLANILSACAVTAGSSQGDRSACDQFFAATNPGSTPATAPTNTLQALFNLARDVKTGTLFKLAVSHPHLQPSLQQEPADWTLGIHFATAPKSLIFNGAGLAKDGTGNTWVTDQDHSATEYVGTSPMGTAKVQPTANTPAWPAEVP